MNPLLLSPVYAIFVLCYGYLGYSANTNKNRLLLLYAKMACSALFIVTAFVSRAYAPDGSRLWFGMMLTALFLSFAGDFFLALPNHGTGQKADWFLTGSSCFLCTHIVLIILYHFWGSFSFLAIILAVLLEGVSILAAKKAGLQFGRMAPVAIVYSGRVLFMVCNSFMLLFKSFSAFSLLVCIGSFLFLVSDCLLTYNHFSAKSRCWREFGNTITYFGGQFLLALSIALV